MAISLEWKKYAEKCMQAIDDLDELPDAAADFVAGVGPKLRSMYDWINENERVTPKMTTAIDNIISGIEKWQRRSND